VTDADRDLARREPEPRRVVAGAEDVIGPGERGYSEAREITPEDIEITVAGDYTTIRLKAGTYLAARAIRETRG
jgi:hypothetical protein